MGGHFKRLKQKDLKREKKENKLRSYLCTPRMKDDDAFQ